MRQFVFPSDMAAELTLVECVPNWHIFVISDDDKFGIVEEGIYNSFICPSTIRVEKCKWGICRGLSVLSYQGI